jgi:putative DNA primase/helicase
MGRGAGYGPGGRHGTMSAPTFDHPFSPGEGAGAATRGAAAAREHGLTPPTNSQNGAGHTGAGSSLYPLNDVGNAQRLLDAGGRDHLLYVPKRQFPWHLWDGTCWPQDREQRVGLWMEAVLRAAYADTWQNGVPRGQQTEEANWLRRSGDEHNLAAALSVASRHVSVLPDVFDTHDWYLPCSNGLTYNLETGQVIASLPEHRMSRCVPVPALRGPEPHPKWDAVVRLVMGDDPEMVRYLRQMLGLCATGYVGEKAFWFWQGKTNAGKTMVLTCLARLLGPFVYCIPLRALLKQRQDTGILHDIAGIRGMRLVYAEEFKPGDVLDSAWVKKISGEGDVTADRKGEPNETFRSTAKLIIGTNDMPALTDVDSALRGRVRVVPFPADIPAAMKTAGKPLHSVDEVVDDLLTEAPAILYDLVQAVGEWRTAGKCLGMPKTVAQASKKYLDNQDPLLEWLDTCCKKQPDGSLTTRRVELALAVWYWSFLGQSERADTKALYQQFGEMLTAKGFEKRVAYDGKRYTGPALTAEAVRVAQAAADEAYAAEWRRKHGRE